MPIIKIGSSGVEIDVDLSDAAAGLGGHDRPVDSVVAALALQSVEAAAVDGYCCHLRVGAAAVAA